MDFAPSPRRRYRPVRSLVERLDRGDQASQLQPSKALSAIIAARVAASATEAVLFAEGIPEPLVNAAPVWTAWRELGNEDTAGMELDATRVVFEQLGAAPDLARGFAGSAGDVR